MSPATSSSLALLFASLLVPSSLAQTSGTFDILTFNVAGLPAFLNDNGVPGDKATNAGSVGTKFAQYGYDVIQVQEDFNYHAYIYATDTHPYRTATSGGVPFGSGLNTLSNYNWSTFNRITWDKCNINEGDCLTPKGFTMMRSQIDGAEIDFYNLHADAGSDSGDATARRSGITQILAYITANSAGRATIIAGDTNDRYTNTERSIDLLTAAGFTDTWVQLIKGGVQPAASGVADACGNPAVGTGCEVVDKVLYRSGGGVTLSPKSFAYDGGEFLQANGSVLSDHNPILVNFAWSKS